MRCRSSPRRALPDARDGLKPVHRRILYGMYAGGLRPDRKHQKSAAAVGDVMGKFHPHGDTAMYDAVARMAQDFPCGTRSSTATGTSAPPTPTTGRRQCATPSRGWHHWRCSCWARSTRTPSTSHRPTTATPSSRPCCRRDFPTSWSTEEAGSPSVWRRTSRRNLGEVIDAVQHLLDNPEATNQDLMQFVRGPDFPSGALILGRSGIHDAYTTGRGSIKMRAVARWRRPQGVPRASP